MSALRFSVLIIFFPILLGACGRSDLIRIRILSPISETKKDHTIFTDTSSSTAKKITTADPKTSGGSLYFLFKSIGLGYTTVTTKIDNEILNSSSNALLLREKTTLVTNYTDLAFGIGENYTLMWGAGVLAGGKLDTTLNYSEEPDETVLHKNLSGHSLFLMLGHHGFGFETLLGFRTNYIKADLEDSLSTAKKKKAAGSISYESSGLRFTTNQVQLGIGFTF
ncbi:MAG TPA: hypothetical protein EYN57_09820 [Candidatus Lambdaproteobacteria bacterium]|nr:hypothetical protein [Candidatus Lambdaproteobacteria bacterium]